MHQDLKTGDLQAERGPSGRFRAGRSGNPRGRPKGSRNRAQAIALRLLDEGAEECIRELVKQAKAGDKLALRLVVERIIPRAPRIVPDPVPSLARAGDVVSGLAEVVRLAASGALSLEEAAGFARLLELQRKALETDELAVRLEALEAAEREERL